MRSQYMLWGVAGLMTLGAWWLASPATAVTDSPMRQILEKAFFSERLIKDAIYPKTTKDVYAVPKRKFIHGLPRISKPFIYEPDRYTWELAEEEHNRKLLAQAPAQNLLPGTVQPLPMSPMAIPPTDPGQVQLMPLGMEQTMLKPLPPDADVRMQAILDRARMTGVNPGAPLRADDIKARLLQHMNTLNQSPAAISPSAPAIPLLPPTLPRGQAGDSYDPSYDRQY